MAPVRILDRSANASRTLEPGDWITRDLRLAHRLSRGSMGSGHVAHDHRFARDVAVKVMAPELAADPTLEARFDCDARAGAKIQGPQVVSLLSHGVTVDGLVYIVMELGEGETLREPRSARSPSSGRGGPPPPRTL